MVDVEVDVGVAVLVLVVAIMEMLARNANHVDSALLVLGQHSRQVFKLKT